MISSPNGIEKLPGDDSRHGRSGAHGGSDGVNAVRGGGAGAEADSRERMGGGHAAASKPAPFAGKKNAKDAAPAN